MFSRAFLTEGKAPWWKLQSLFALLRFFGGTEQLAWILQWIMTATVAVGLALMWRSPVRYFVESGRARGRHLADHALPVHVRHDGAGHSGGLPGPHRAQDRLSPI